MVVMMVGKGVMRVRVRLSARPRAGHVGLT